MGSITKMVRALIEAKATPEMILAAIEVIENEQVFYTSRPGIPKSDWEGMRLKVFERDGYKCVYCNINVKDNPQCDHIMPLARGGITELSNLNTACKSCNSSKSEWRCA